MEFIRVSLDDLESNPTNLLTRPLPKPTDKDFPRWKEEFCDSIEKLGLLNSFSVRKQGDKYLVIDGNHRLAAMRINRDEGRPNTVAMLNEGLQVRLIEASDEESMAMQLNANHNHKEQKAAHKAATLQKLVYLGWPMDKICYYSGMSEATVDKYLKLNTLPEKVRTAVDDGDIILSNALQLCNLPMESTSDEVSMAGWVEKALTLGGNEFAAEVAKEVKAVRDARRTAGGAKRATEFVPTAKLRSKDEINEELTKAQYAFETTQSTEDRIKYEVLKWVFSLDDLTIAAAKDAHEKAVKEAEDKKAAKAAEKAKKEAEDAAQLLKDLGYSVTPSTPKEAN